MDFKHPTAFSILNDTVERKIVRQTKRESVCVRERERERERERGREKARLTPTDSVTL